ncbi:MAG: twin-arginine translocation signal domain-containing protein [Candidatus Latescibacterota bacterium]|jgi:hypothetical protein
MNPLDRRNFLKNLALASAATTVASLVPGVVFAD